jgi:hypothetical protein
VPLDRICTSAVLLTRTSVIPYISISELYAALYRISLFGLYAALYHISLFELYAALYCIPLYRSYTLQFYALFSRLDCFAWLSNYKNAFNVFFFTFFKIMHQINNYASMGTYPNMGIWDRRITWCKSTVTRECIQFQITLPKIWSHWMHFAPGGLIFGFLAFWLIWKLINPSFLH